MDGFFALLAIAAIIIFLAVVAKRRIVIMRDLKIDDIEVIKLIDFLGLTSTRSIAVFVFAFNRRGVYVDLWAELMFSYKKKDRQTALQYWHRIYSEFEADSSLLGSSYETYESCCIDIDRFHPDHGLEDLVVKCNQIFETVFKGGIRNAVG